MVGAHAQIDIQQIAEAVNGESRPGEQGKRQGKLAHHQRPAQRWRPLPVPERPPSLSDSAGSIREAYHAGTQPKRRPVSVVTAMAKPRIGRFMRKSASAGRVRAASTRARLAARHSRGRGSPAEKGQQEIFGEKLLEDHGRGRAQGTRMAISFCRLILLPSNRLLR